MGTNPERLLARAQRTFGELRVDQAVAKVRAVIGLPQVPQSEAAAQAAMDKLKTGRARPTAMELAALEFVIRMMRPAPRSMSGQLEPLPAKQNSSVYQPEVSAAWEQFRVKSKKIIYSVGRLDRATGPNAQIGTGFLIGGDLVLTNHHVLSALSHGSDELDEGMAVIRFYQEYEGPEPIPACPIVKVAAVHATFDMALLQVRMPEPRPVLELVTTPTPEHLMVATVGYSFEDGRNPLFVDAIYQGQYGIKRGAFGELMDRQGHLLWHDCSTLGGNSGSPLMGLDTSAVVGLHFSGEFMYRNEAVAASEVAEFVKQVSGK